MAQQTTTAKKKRKKDILIRILDEHDDPRDG
jgi:hypothetical protein